MSAVHHEQMPRLPLYAAISLVLASIVVVGGQRIGILGAPPAAETRQATATLSEDLRFFDQPDGGVRVVVASGEERLIPTASGGFVRGVLRSLVRERRSMGLGAEQAFRVTQWSDGSVTIHDLATGRTLNLNAFGPTNRQDFIALIAPAGSPALSAGAAA
ncbi:photosynthetic complex assembly protein PuhC [Brevundimonas sp. R86498]|uniref:photosynthetic complex assembly protein PuhC n=1 Tax=Brevundimonas sp. R86498 TaxID=3093845 RepID=UPI0037C51F7B